jgi:endoglucanase
VNRIVKRLLQGMCAVAFGAAAACGGVNNSANPNTAAGASASSAGVVALSAASYSVAQSAGSVQIIIDRADGSAGAVSIGYATSNGTAVAGTDYTAATGSIDWADGDAASKSVSIPISTSPAWSGSKSFSVTLSNPSGGATIGTLSASTVQVSGSGAPVVAPGTLSLSAATYVAAQNVGALVVTINRTAGFSGAVGITYATSDGTATAGTDYTAATGTVEWAADDAAAKTFSVPISNATPFVGSRSFMIALSSPTGGATVGTPSSATATINGDAVSANPGALGLSGSAYAATQNAGSLVVTVDRSGGTTGTVSVKYSTSDGTAIAGTNYTKTQGTLTWAAGNSAAQTFAVPISASPVLTASKGFTVTLSSAGGGATLGTSSATATINVNGASSVSVRVQGNHLIDANGKVLQLRGVDVSGLEFAPIDGSPGPDGWGGQKPNLSAIAAWKANTLRIPLNEASYLGYTCYDPPNGTAHNPDPMGDYKQLVKQIVTDATALGWYVILDLHKNAPKGTVNGKLVEIAPQSTTQNQMADADNSLAFWTAIATDFKGYPNVIFDLFNEPYFDNVIAPSGVSGANVAWTILREGGTNTLFYGGNTTFSQNWTSAGMQALVNAVRAAGATNVVMSAGVSWAQDNSQWAQFAPTDPLKQLALSWHAYPMYGAAFGSAGYTNPGFAQGYAWAQTVLDAGYPIIIGETGDQSSAGTSSAPFLAVLLPWVDARNVSVIGWSWNAWGSTNDDLIKDANGTPTDGYGVAFHAWLVNHP